MTDTTMIVDTLERAERLRRGLVAKRRAVAEAEAAVGDAGWNKSAAVRKVREAEEALTVQETEIADLLAGLPEIRDDSMRWLYGRVAAIRVNRGRVARRIAAAETALAEAEAEAGKDSWKWKARAAATGGEPKAVTAAREALATARHEGRAFEEDSADIMAMFDSHAASANEQAEVEAWAATNYEGERPECIVRAAREFAAEMAEGCDRLPIPPKSRRKHIFVTAGPVPEEDPDPLLAFGEWGTPQTVEEYLNQLVPPPPPPTVEEFHSSTKGGTPVWIKRLLEAKKARRVAPVK
jgi:hypothetical protein